MKGYYVYTFIGILLLCFSLTTLSQDIPLPEHPRPDFERPQWENLNGIWEFEFDPQNRGITEDWASTKTPFSQSINVPFPWGSKLSGVSDEGRYWLGIVGKLGWILPGKVSGYS